MDQRKMFYGAIPDIFKRARRLRENMTGAEKMLWEQLSMNKMGMRFKPQHPVKYFILDFYCHELKLAIELDGEIHQFQKEKDQSRIDELDKLGIVVIRFKNDQVLQQMEMVLKIIKETVASRRDFISQNSNNV